MCTRYAKYELQADVVAFMCFNISDLLDKD